MTAHGWKERLDGKLDESLAREIDIFEKQIELRKQGKLDEKVFAETRLRRGVYGQRYDNGRRHDGVASRTLSFPCGDLVKGPDTVWDAPGMMRIKIPFGRLTPDQMDMLADLAEEYSDAICHVTTRQDVQLHFVHIDDTPTLMRRLATTGITTREACGNSVRNVTACPFSGVCNTESFDVTPYADALTYYLLGHDDTQDFGRKFKIAFSGCRDEACGIVSIHDLGFIATTKDGKRGFETYVGGGLGAVPRLAQRYSAFVTEEEILPLALAICRVFARLGEKRNRARARLKFVVAKLGIDEFCRVVTEERASLRDDPRWTDYLKDIERHDEQPLQSAASLVRKPSGPFEAWRATNVRQQKQVGHSVATVSCPLGDLSSAQMRAVADLAREFTPGTVRTTVEQNLVLRWVRDEELPALHERLLAIGLGASGAGTIVDVTACPGTDTCKLGIAASRGLAGVLSERLAAKSMQFEQAVRGLRIKVSGCFNSCGQHQVADIGFWGVSRKKGSFVVPHFQTVLGGQWSENGKSYGLAMGAVPSRNIPQTVDNIIDDYLAGRNKSESFQDYVGRVGKKHMRGLLEDLMVVPSHDDDPSYYSDWGDPRQFSIGDLGVGECAGEVVSYAEFGLAASEREVFEALEHLEGGDTAAAGARAYSAMVQAAKALTKEMFTNLSDDPNEIIHEFRARLYDTKLFFDPFAGGKFAAYIFRAHDQADAQLDEGQARQRIEEAQLFIEAAHSCYGRMAQAAAS